MKSKILFLTPAWVYLTLIPQILLLTFAVHNNDGVDTPFKLYPLIVVLSLCIMFTVVYFFRIAVISFEEVRCIGLFSPRERIVIEKDKTIGFKILKKGKVELGVYEPSDATPVFTWLEGDIPDTINVFRTTAYAKSRQIKGILKYYEVDEADIPTIMTRTRPEDGSVTPNESYKYFEKEYELITVSAYAGAEDTEIRIFFKETV